MMDWKEVDIISYLELTEEKAVAQREMTNDPAIAKLKEQLNVIKKEITIQEQKYRVTIQDCEGLMQNIKEKLIARWDTEVKSFKCNKGSAFLRTTRSLKVDNKEILISTLQQIGKLTQSIKGWDLTYLRTLTDAGLFDVDRGEPPFVHYDEKMSVIISGAKNKENVKNEE